MGNFYSLKVDTLPLTVSNLILKIASFGLQNTQIKCDRLATPLPSTFTPLTHPVILTWLF